MKLEGDLNVLKTEWHHISTSRVLLHLAHNVAAVWWSQMCFSAFAVTKNKSSGL